MFGSSLRVRRASGPRVDRLRVGGEKKDIGPGQIGGVRPCGSSSIKVAGICILALVYFPFGCCSLVCGIGLLLGNLSLWNVYPNLPIAWAPNHRLSAVGLSYALETINYNYKLNDVDPTFI